MLIFWTAVLVCMCSKAIFLEIYILGTIFWKLPCKENGDQNKFIQAFNRAKKSHPVYIIKGR